MACGIVSVALGVVGALVPLLPTTPFLLLAAFLFARSSPRWHDRLLRQRWVGSYLRRYIERRGMSRRHKGVTIALLWLVLGASAVLAAGPWWSSTLLLGVGLGVTVHLLRLPAV